MEAAGRRGARFEWGARTYLMGIVNVTPDSFSGDGRPDRRRAVLHGLRLAAEGADLLDVGGMSTRPGHGEVSVEEELARVVPVIEELAAAAAVPISVDTFRPAVARAALEAGACVVNDVWGVRGSVEMAAVAAPAGAALVVMHNRVEAEYRDLVGEVCAELARAAAAAVEAGMPADRVWVDPGIGFGKNADHNLELLRRLAELRQLGHPLVVGTSRKRFIGLLTGKPPGERVMGTAATVTAAVLRGADVVRVHDVAAIADVVRVADQLR